MNKKILNTAVQNFIVAHTDIDVVSVLLKKAFFEEVSNRELAEQLEARKKCEKKLPSWFNTPNIYYPNKLNIEQASSEATGNYKTELVNGETLIDLTGGLGIDSYYFSKKINHVFHCEINGELSKIANHNFKVLNANNIVTIPEDGILFLKSRQHRYDWIYVDPSRRNNTNRRVFQLADCIPDVSNNLDLFFEKSDNILIKTSPLLDISKGISELRNVYQIHIIALNNEVKELLWVLKKGYDKEVAIKTINIQKTGTQKFNFPLLTEKDSSSNFSKILSYIYEPNSAIMKSGGFNTVSTQFNLLKLHPNTHLYTSSVVINFPGRCFKVIASYRYHKKTFKKTGIRKANISIRNFPYPVAKLRKDLQITDGGEVYLFFLTDYERHLTILQCSKV